MKDKEDKASKNGAEGESKDRNYCCVKNCGKEIPHGTGMRIGDDMYCAVCGAAIIKESMGL